MKKVRISISSLVVMHFILMVFQISSYAAKPPFNGTIYMDSEIINSNDPSVFENITYTSKEYRSLWDIRINKMVKQNVYLFKCDFTDGTSCQIQVSEAFGTLYEARYQAKKYGLYVGKLPEILRSRVKRIGIIKGGGKNSSSPKGDLWIQTDTAEIREKLGVFEEVLIHEGTHIALDSVVKNDPKWIAAQKADGNFISNYAKKYPRREDVAESYIAYLAIKYKKNRIKSSVAERIMKNIPNRIAYFEKNKFEKQKGRLIVASQKEQSDGGFSRNLVSSNETTPTEIGSEQSLQIQNDKTKVQSQQGNGDSKKRKTNNNFDSFALPLFYTLVFPLLKSMRTY